MAFSVTFITRYFERGNLVTGILTPIGLIGSCVFYNRIVEFTGPYGIDTQVVYSYVFNLFAIELGAIISLFALLACRPTDFIRRIQNTHGFRMLFWNIKITMLVMAAVIFYTFILGILKTEPDKIFSRASFVFILWCWFCLAVTAFYIRSIRLIFLVLT